MNDEFVRKLPFSLIAEQSLLGSILVDPESLNDVAETVCAFYLTCDVSVSKKRFVCKGVFSLLSCIVESTFGANSATADAFIQFSHTVHTKLAH